MFCPKCGLENGDDTKFCRSCGGNLSNVLAMVEGRMPDQFPQSKQNKDIFSSGIRNLILGFGFIFISILLFTLPGNTFFWLLMMIPAIVLLSSGIGRLVKSSQPKAVNYQAVRRNSLPASPQNSALPPVQTDYIKPEKSNYRTEDLAGAPFSVTESTTRHLEIDDEKAK